MNEPLSDLSSVSPAKGGRKAQSHLFWGIGGVLGVFLVAIACLRRPVVLRAYRSPDRVEAIAHIREVYGALEKFDSTYGSYPDASTASRIKAASGTPLTLGEGSSNQFFRQLLATVLRSETPFHAKIPGAIKPDNRFADDAHALSHGECAFSYAAGLSSQSLPSLPLLMTPMIPGTNRFDPKPF
ncbi:MAG: hypothetical protein JWO82_3789, partial [Akkermansiaceae bacterium]|nr:hypothetical protein [Akkermansiaceae bacterium]